VKENIYLRGAAMGLSIPQCHDLVAPVLEFSGLQGRAGDRLRVLSAGQRMRLGFSITTELQNDILLMDEWIGAGDAEFFERAQSRLMGRVDGAKIVIVASHNIPLLRKVCNRRAVPAGRQARGGRSVRGDHPPVDAGRRAEGAAAEAQAAPGAAPKPAAAPASAAPPAAAEATPPAVRCPARRRRRPRRRRRRRPVAAEQDRMTRRHALAGVAWNSYCPADGGPRADRRRATV
jgi:hypothetical protein